MYCDDYGRQWEGAYPFALDSITSQAPNSFGVYQILYPSGGSFQVAYIGIATGDTIRGRLTKHCRGFGNWALARLGSPSEFKFCFYRCDGHTAQQIETHVVSTLKPPFNVRPEYRHFVPSIYIN
jgi:hypothetical protein